MKKAASIVLSVGFVLAIQSVAVAKPREITLSLQVDGSRNGLNVFCQAGTNSFTVPILHSVHQSPKTTGRGNARAPAFPNEFAVIGTMFEIAPLVNECVLNPRQGTAFLVYGDPANTASPRIPLSAQTFRSVRADSCWNKSINSQLTSDYSQSLFLAVMRFAPGASPSPRRTPIVSTSKVNYSLAVPKRAYNTEALRARLTRVDGEEKWVSEYVIRSEAPRYVISVGGRNISLALETRLPKVDQLYLDVQTSIEAANALPATQLNTAKFKGATPNTEFCAKAFLAPGATGTPVAW